MAFVFRGAGTAANGNNATSLTPTLPTGTQVGDLLVVHVQTFGGTGSRVPSIGGSYTSTAWANGTAHHLLAFKIATASEPNPVVTFTGTGVASDTQVTRCCGFFSTSSSVSIVLDVQGATSTNASADNIGPITGITVGGTGGHLSLVTAGKTNDYNGIGTLTEYVQAALTESVSGNDAGMALLYRLATPAGATGNLTVVDNGGTASNGLGFGRIVSFAEQATIVMAADVGAVVLAGQPATLRTDLRMVTASAALTLTGQVAELRFGRALVAVVGAFALIGAPATVSATRRLTADAGAVTYIGQPASLFTTQQLSGAAGSVTVVGQSAALALSRHLGVDPSSVALTGQPGALRVTRLVFADAGQVTLTGASASLRRGHAVLAAGQAFALTGQTANVHAARVLLATGGTVAAIGQPALLQAAFGLPAAAAAVTLSGQPAALARASRLVSSVGVLALTGQAATLTATSSAFIADAGAFVAIGQPAALRVQVSLAASAATVVLIGQSATLAQSKRLFGIAGAFACIGQPATLSVASVRAVLAGATTTPRILVVLVADAECRNILRVVSNAGRMVAQIEGDADVALRVVNQQVISTERVLAMATVTPL